MLGWRVSGSVAADDWLGTAVLAALLVVAVLGSGAAVVPSRLAVAGVGGLVALAAWTALSLTWAPVPSLARDEALLVLLYALAALLPVLALRFPLERLLALGALAAAAAATAVVAAVELATVADPAGLFRSGRLEHPVGYTNAEAAVLLIGLWPALALAAARALPVLLRGLALAAAAAVLAGWLTTQSKGAGIGLAVSALAVFALSGGRLRLAVPTLLAAGCAAAAVVPLTEPYRAGEDAAAAAAAATGAGRALLAVTAGALVLGVLYALLDRRLQLSERALGRLRVATAVALAASAVVLAVVLVAATGRPDRALERGWDAFSTYHPEEGGAGTHLASLGGSNRYDFWRVSLEGFADHPVTGVGSRGFGAVYLQEGVSHETPARAHSIVFDTLLELGLVGLALLVLALAPFLWLAAAAARRRRAHGVAALGGCAGWLAHASVDWTWTFPAAGIPFFLLLGIGASGQGTELLSRGRAFAGAAAATAAAALLFVPAWLAGRFVDRAQGDPTSAARDLRWARVLDPISSRPYVVEANQAPTAEAALPALRRAAEREPDAVAVRFLLGVRLLEAGRREEAVAELERARELAPREELVLRTLEQARG